MRKNVLLFSQTFVHNLQLLHLNYFVSSFKGLIKLLAHAVMLDSKEGRVEDDADGDGRFEEGVVNHLEEEVLELEPARVADAATATSSTVPILRCFWQTA